MTKKEAISRIGWYRKVIIGTLSDPELEQKMDEAFAMAIEALKQTWWIPCSENLPKDVEEGEEYPTVIYCTEDYTATGFYDYVTEEWWDAEGYPVDVIAWMPLPDPYMRGEEE